MVLPYVPPHQANVKLRHNELQAHSQYALLQVSSNDDNAFREHQNATLKRSIHQASHTAGHVCNANHKNSRTHHHVADPQISSHNSLAILAISALLSPFTVVVGGIATSLAGISRDLGGPPAKLTPRLDCCLSLPPAVGPPSPI